MKRTAAAPTSRTFRWPLAPLERKMDAAVENARLALQALQQEAHSQEQAARRRQAYQREQEDVAARSIQRDPRAGADAVRYLASLHAARVAAEASRTDLEQRLAAGRAECADLQRQLEAVQALRDRAHRVHAQGEVRRECRDADAAWLALAQQRRAAAVRAAGDAD
jgi:flagellar biosynthesis chaperone FliJ